MTMRHIAKRLLVPCALCFACAITGACNGKPATASAQNFCNKSPGIADGAIVIRGGQINAESLAEGGVVDQAGYMTDLSVNCSADVDAPNTGANRALYRQGIPNAQYGVTSARKVCQEGGYLAVTPYEGHPYHCTLWHLKPKDAASLFTQY